MDDTGITMFIRSGGPVFNMSKRFRVSWKGTHTGDFMGIAPTRKGFSMQNTGMVKIRANKLLEWWGTFKIPLIMQEFGVTLK